MLRLLLILAIAAALLIVGIAYLMAYVRLRPPRMTDGKAAWILKRLSPGDLGLAFEPLWFQVHDERTGRPLRLAAWWIPSPVAHDRCILLIHGYADAKVGAIAWAPLLHELGWNILAVDLRAHGESDGQTTTGGYYEREDISQVINQLQAERPDQTRTLVLFGLSYGAAVAAATAALRDDLAGVVLESPFASYTSAEMAYCRLMGFPGPLIQRLAMGIYQWLSGADLESISPSRLIPAITCPLLLILSKTDPFVPPAALAQIEASIQKRFDEGRPTAYWSLPDTGHLLGMAEHPELYRQRMSEFLDSL